METTRHIQITKIDPERRLFGGWAYVAKNVDGQIVEDHSGDVIDTPEAWSALTDAMLDYAVEGRDGDDMHETFEVAKLAEFFISDPEKWETLGIGKGVLPQGVFVSFRATNTDGGNRLWEAVKSGERKALSIVGTGRTEQL